MMYLQLEDPWLIRSLNAAWLILAKEIESAEGWERTSDKMKSSYYLLKNIEQEVYRWFFGDSASAR